MSLEQALAANTAAIEKLTAILTQKTGEATPAEPAKPKKAAAPDKVAAAQKPETPSQTIANLQNTPAEITVTKEMVQAAGNDLTKLVELDRPAAVALLGEFGVPKMTALDSKRIPEFHNKVKAKLAALAGGNDNSLV